MRRALLLFTALFLACGSGDDADDDAPLPDSGVPDVGPLVPGDTDGDEWPEEVDNCPGLFNPEQRDRDDDGIGDSCDSCPATPNNGGDAPEQDECDPVDEQEPNDLPGTGEAVTLVDLGRIREVRGTIEAPAAGQSFDRYQILAPAKTLMRVRVARAKPESLLEPIIMVTGGGYTTPRIADGQFLAERQIYVAEAGMYEIAVADRRGVLENDPRGAGSYAYALAIEVLDATAESVNAPFTNRAFTLAPPGTVRVYQATLAASDFVRIATETDLSMGALEGLDTVLIVERADGTVIENDDLAEGFLDSRVILELAAQETLRVVLDHHRIYGSEDLEVRLTIDTPPNNLELEPNDVVGLASDLVFPGETVGRINAAADPNVGPPDIDWYRFEGIAGQIIALTGLIPASSQVNPVFLLGRLIDEETGQVETLYFNLDSTGLAPRIEAILHESGTYVLGVADQRNLDMPPFVGNDDETLMRYGIFSEPVGLQPEAVILTESGTVSAPLSTGGRLVRHLIVPSGPTVISATTIATSGPEVMPFLRIYGPNATGLLGEGAAEAVAYLPSAESYVLAVHNDNNGAGDVAYNYDLFVRFLAANAPTDETEPNDERTAADVIGAALPSLARGAIVEGNSDFFRIALAQDQTVSIAISEGSAGKNLSLYDGGGAFLVGGAGSLGFTAPAGGDYLIEVSGTAGPYLLILR